MSDISDVDAFDQQQEKLLLEQSMRGDRRRHYDHMEMSDEEVMGFKPSDSEDEEDDDDEILDREEEDDGEAQEAWGKGELYGADEIEDEEDRKLEAEEALKLQKKQAKQMKESDFLGEWAADDSDDEDEEDADLATAGKGVRESIPVKPIESMSSKEQYDQLVRLNPELVLMNAELAKVTEEMAALNKAEEDEDDEPEIVEIKKTALRTYIGVLNAYFALFMDSVKNGKANMKDHIIMEAILKAREMWRMAQEIGLPEEEVDEMASDEEMVSEGAELMDASAAESDVSDDLDLSRFRRRPEDDFEDVEEVEEEVDSDDELALPTSFKAKKSKSKISAVPDYGEHAINDVDQADKDRRKRDLRFYTAKIDKQARGREQEEIEGDADLPYQDRWYERQQQLKEKQAAHIKDSGEHDLYDSGDEGGSADDYQEMSSKKSAGGDDDEDVDEFVAALKAKKQQRKAEREAMHEVYLDAKKGKIDVEKLDDNGKRAINYQILKNKGLTPHRKKENRNSRVKKRIKYEKAKKKLASTRAVYKQPTGAYAGEKTGIKKNLARSTKFRE
ncbi:Sas10 C-terminal domain-domain-containing protein [Yarrowia lipolytica]|uniref:YALI0F20372p n=1 Tax=Yarrowia lipolytica (strain CLIB 122 / E 150) TaxID=284591 RepID=Q6C102_YARLI|nr:YALI0F20372p [Yarrowia lipolytica CLIB122]RDW35967.1 Sas10 C-terminal domain-domain-containing protein [Yarrowia lipolytica]RDW42248.1 Sas10 C-terminal domain-domain-containing protein [Yarrowia lipolytica]RDW49503.1 Sas10 C-terminal domain-domain-containing protein [Yarrowia lipolytica]RDW55495.1 Sas10 C-terminal domain-domain-containing protein [Yarrowia lipolytica]CAG78469.1 YALI0F20372p [Yarrowia lipolytica CLIB122]|eukprot:XP_505660.1 YALI0F20372p [Yarrowia lipolytica CLIB122]